MSWLEPVEVAVLQCIKDGHQRLDKRFEVAHLIALGYVSFDGNLTAITGKGLDALTVERKANGQN